MELLQLSERMVQLGPVGPSLGLQEVLSVPGTRLVQDQIGQDHLQLPRSSWGLDVIRSYCHELRVDPPQWRADVPNFSAAPSLLRAYQAVGVQWLLYSGGGLLADMLGLGKTRTAAMAASLMSQSRRAPVVIVGPKFLRRTWQDELARIGAIESDRDFHALSGTKLDVALWNRDARYLYCHYDIIPIWWNWIWPLKPAAVIIDEAHYLKNARTKRAKGVAAAVSMCPHRILLTGTPILNHVGEFWNLLNLAEGPWSFGTPKTFRQRYAGAYHSGYGLVDGPAPTHTDELQKRLELCYLRRTADEVGLELPSLSRSVIHVPLDPKQRATHAGFFADRDPRELVDAILKQRTSTASLMLLGAIRKFTSEAKFKTTVARVRDHRAAGEDVVVFTWERRMAERIAFAVGGPDTIGVLEQRVPAPVVIHGGVDQDARDIHIADFQKQGGCIVATLESLSVGVNLQRARVVVIHDLDYTPAKLLQAEGRVWRQGQTRPVLSEWIVVEHSLDSFFVQHLVQKAHIIDQALDDDHPAALAGILAPIDDFEERFAAEVRRWRESRAS